MSRTPTIRLFVSSTFSDLKAERDVLQADVFPEVRRFCLASGFRFQAIDLRWGISEEAGRHNRTMRICLRELRRCQTDHLKPNFLILLGERYGWRPLPEVIPAALFTSVAEHMRRADGVCAQLLERCYRVDENAVPPVAELQPRGRDDDWEELVEGPLLAGLESALRVLGADPEDGAIAVGTSATEQEIVAGALGVADAAAHVRAFFRTIDGLPPVPPEDFRDRQPEHSRQSLSALKDRIERHLGSEHICHFHVPWRNGGIDPNDLGEFRDRALNALLEIVKEQIDAAVTPLSEEAEAHDAFSVERSRHFVGRRDELQDIVTRLTVAPGRPLAIVGPAGSGKSAAIARLASTLDRDPNAQVITRYIGVTPVSSDLVQLLGNVLADIRRLYPSAGLVSPADEAIPVDYHALVGAFFNALERATANRPLFLLFDGLDQLTAAHDARALSWLPRMLPEHVHIVVSAASPAPPGDGATATEGPGGDPRTDVWRALFARVPAERTVALAPLSATDGEQMLSMLLEDARRTLKESQRDAILQAFATEGNPLWLRIAADEAARLASWSEPPEFPPATRGLLQAVLARLSRDEEHGEILVSHFLSYLVCARHGLAEDEVLDLLSADADVMQEFRRRSPTEQRKRGANSLTRLPVAVWVALLGDLAFYLSEHQAQGTRLIAFYHRSVGEAAAVKDPASWHARLAGYFRRQASGDNQSPWRQALRPLSELAFHLTQAGELDALRALYLDMAYVDARSRSFRQPHPANDSYPGMVDFLGELRAASRMLEHRDRTNAEPIDAVVRLLVDRSALLSRFPESTVQEIANYLERYSHTPDVKTIVDRARSQPASLPLRRSAIPETAAGHGGSIRAIAVSPSGREFLTGAQDGSVGYWNVFKDQPYWVTAAHEQGVTSIAFSPDGRRALTAGRDGSILIWDLDLASRRLVRPLGPHASHAWVGGFIDEDTAVAAAAGMAFTLDITSGTILWRSESEGETLPALSLDRRRLCLAGPRPGRAPGQSHTLQLYPVGETARELASLPRPTKHLLFSPGGNLVFAADSTGHLLTYDLAGTLLRDITLRPPLASWCAMSDGTLLVCGLNGQLSRFSIPDGAEIPQFISDSWNENRAANVLAPLPNNRVLAGNQDGSIALVDLTAGISGRVWKPGITFVAGTLLPDGGAVTVRGERQQGEDTLGRTLFKVSPDARIAEMTASPHSQFISGVAAVGTHVLTVDRGGTATMWRESEPVRVHRRYGEVFTCCSGSTDNPAGVAGTSLDEVRIVGIGPTVRPISLPRGIGAHAPGVSAVAAAGAPLQIIVALNNSEVASVGSCEWRVKAGSGMGTSAALDPSRELAATGHAFGKVHVWNSLSGQETGAWQLHTGPILALTFGADGLLYTAGADRCLLGIDPLTGRVMSATMSAGSPLALRWAENILTVLDSFGGLYAFACGTQLNTRDTSAPEPSVTGRAEKPRGHHD